MADKTVFYKDRPIQGNTIADFYSRLNALRALGGLSAYTVFNPSGSKTVGTDVSTTQSKILETKNALSFLSSINISSFTPTTPTAGSIMIATSNIAKEEKEIGILESACFTFRSGNRSTFHGNNFTQDVNKNICATFHSSNNSTFHSAKCSTVHGTFHATHGAKCTTVHSGNNVTFHSANGAQCATVHATFNVTNHANKHATFHSQKTATAHSSFNKAKHGTFNSSNRKSGKDHHYWLFHASNSFCSAGKQTNKTSHNTKHYTSNGHTTFHSAKKSTVHGTFFSTNGCVTNFAAKCATVHSNKNVTFHSAKTAICSAHNAAKNAAFHTAFCTTVHSSKNATHGGFCSTVHSNKNVTFNAPVCTSVHNSNNATVHSSNFNFAVAFKANHSVFKVEGLDF